jgi:hypothetical protein
MVDRVLTEKRIEPRERMRIKSALAQIGWFD